MSISRDQATQTVGPFKVSGINHLALVCRDMQQTVDFYEGVLGFPLVKTIELPETTDSTSSSTSATATVWHSSTSPTHRMRCPACRRRTPTPSSTRRPSW